MGGRGFLKVLADDGWSGMGGYWNAKLQKLDEQFDDRCNRIQKLSSIFDGVAIHVNGYTNPTADELKSLMAQHGGKFHLYYSSAATTHIIASNIPRAKAKDIRPNQKIVRPEWITDSIKEGKLLSIQPYLLAMRRASRMQKTLSGLSNNSIFAKADFRKDENKSATPTIQALDDHSVPSDTKEYKSHGGSSDLSKPLEKHARTIVPTADSTFLSDFYAHSRLHFLSTWKTELSDYVRSLTDADRNLVGRDQLIEISLVNPEPGSSRRRGKCIMHIDMDCFFVSVGLLSRPHLGGLPVAVTHHSANAASTVKQQPGSDPDFEMKYYNKKREEASKEKTRGGDHSTELTGTSSSTKTGTVPSYSEIASCSYEARNAGVKNGMFFGKAKELCPDLVAIPYDFEAYREISQQLYNILTSYTKSIEAVSCDEALLDVTNLVVDTGLTPNTIAQHIRSRVKKTTGCDASAGIGPNIVLARMATKVGKPNGQHEVSQNEAEIFISGQSVKNLPGVGWSTASRLKELGAQSCGELQSIPLEVLKKEFGIKTGQKLYDFSRGRDKREVCQSKERKSVSADVNYGIRLTNKNEMITFLANLAKEVSNRLEKAQVTGKKLTLKIMIRRSDAPQETSKFGGHGVCQSLSKSKNLVYSTADCEIIKKEAISLMSSLQVNISDLRGIGIQLTQLQSTTSDSSTTSKATIAKFLQPSDKCNVINGRSNVDVDKNELSNFNPLNDPAEVPAIVAPLPNPPTESGVSNSFLDALPEDIRSEIEKNLEAHQMALQRTKSNNIDGTDKVNNAPSLKSKRGRPAGASRSKQKHSSRNKNSPSKARKGAVVNTKGSPNKLITDMFPFLNKPRNPGDRRGPMTSSPVSLPMEASNQHSSVRRKLKVRFEQPTLVAKQKVKEPEVIPQSPPSLGGAYTVSAARGVIRKWALSFADKGPLDADVTDVIEYLSRLVAESHNLEGADLLLRTLRRCVINVIENIDIMGTFVDNDDAVTSWINAYGHITASIQEIVRTKYNGATLSVPDIT